MGEGEEVLVDVDVKDNKMLSSDDGDDGMCKLARKDAAAAPRYPCLTQSPAPSSPVPMSCPSSPSLPCSPPPRPSFFNFSFPCLSSFPSLLPSPSLSLPPSAPGQHPLLAPSVPSPKLGWDFWRAPDSAEPGALFAHAGSMHLGSADVRMSLILHTYIHGITHTRTHTLSHTHHTSTHAHKSASFLALHRPLSPSHTPPPPPT